MTTTVDKPRTEPPEISTVAGPSIARRRSLPTGRAVIGALLVALAAVGMFTAYRQAVGEPDTEFVIVNRLIEPGSRITPNDVRVEAIELPDAVTSTVFTDASAIVGSVAITPLNPGQLLQRGDILLLAPGESPTEQPWREFSFTISSARAVDGQIRPGERIDLIATYSTQDGAQTVVVFRDAPVLRLSEGGDGILGSEGGQVFTVALVNPATILAAANAIDDAENLTVVRATKIDGQELPDSFSFNPPVVSSDG